LSPRNYGVLDFESFPCYSLRLTASQGKKIKILNQIEKKQKKYDIKLKIQKYKLKQ
jgi:hypothetical protein